MPSLVTSISRFTLLFMIAFYTYDAFAVLRNGISERRSRLLFYRQNWIMFLFLANSNMVLFADSGNIAYLLFFGAEAAFVAALLLIFRKAYPSCEKSLVNHMAFLLSIGFVMLSRLSTTRALRQLVIASAALVLTAFIPRLIRAGGNWARFEIVYALFCAAMLLSVLVLGSYEGGAKLSIGFGPVSFQPSEFVKILFPMYLAAGLVNAHRAENPHRRRILTVLVSLVLILFLVASRDLGGASILSVILLMVYYSDRKHPWILPAGFGAGILALFLAGKAFSHVHERIVAWLDPLSHIENEGWQVSQSLFAIGTGGWFGSGLLQGMPDRIPVVSKDFIFAAISEEFGGLFAVCLLFICFACFLMFMNTAMQIRDPFFRLVSTGFAVCYGFQIFLSVGGTIRFIPSTGVTIPLVSYGGSSLVSTMIMFAVVQGIIMRERRDGNAGQKHS